MDSNLSDLAITQALNGEWLNAVKTNKEILKLTPDETEALNRLARAYFESGDNKNAKKTSLKVLKIDPQNSIALKAINKYGLSSLKLTKKNEHKNVNASDFIEEAGTSKHTELLNICSNDLISTLSPGEELLLLAHSHKVSITTQNNKYLGRVPDDLAAKLRMLIKKGYKFKVIVKSADNKCIKVIIKEAKRGKGYETKKSFIDN